MRKRNLVIGMALLAMCLASGCCRLWDRWCGGPCYGHGGCYAPAPCYNQCGAAPACYPANGYAQGAAPAQYPAPANCP